MTERTHPNPILPFVLAAVCAAAAVFLATQFPPVEGLGTKVRLPVFHGAWTWASLVTFSLMAIGGVAYIATKREYVYRYESGLRWVGVPMWLVGSVMGLTAALNTWDLSGSKSSALNVISADPRLTAQFATLILGGLLLLLPLFVEERVWLAIGDLTFVAVMWALLLRALLGPGRSLHPDSPVLNSPEIKIKLLFFGMFGLLTLGALLAAWGVSRVLESRWAVRSAAE